jgi:hypothetical protein
LRVSIFAAEGFEEFSMFGVSSSSLHKINYLLLFSLVAVNLTACEAVLPIAALTSQTGAFEKIQIDLEGKASSFSKIFPQRENARAFKARGLYLTAWTVGESDKLRHYVELAERTEINSYVVDIKDSDGYVGYESEIPEVRAAKAWQRRYKPRKVLDAFHEKEIRVIARISCFKDPIISSFKHEWAVKTKTGELWKDDDGKTWLNPYNSDCWPYLINIAKEALKLGFDEIQFDYVRFANDGDKAGMRFGDTRDKSKHEAIRDFLAFARCELPDATVSADVFGIICESPGDTEDIGQFLETLGDDVDYLSPMVYPSHYAFGQIVNKTRYAFPDKEPYGVVYNTLLQAKRRTSEAPEFHAGIRPFLQDFTATWLGKGKYQEYGAEQVLQQIKAVQDAGYDQWFLWSARNKYSESAFKKEDS